MNRWEVMTALRRSRVFAPPSQNTTAMKQASEQNVPREIPCG
jgi:hypothetical protein